VHHEVHERELSLGLHENPVDMREPVRQHMLELHTRRRLQRHNAMRKRRPLDRAQ
jgi:hypothetical protein